jgi:farnesyl-diphosphate farnesyltransferase
MAGLINPEIDPLLKETSRSFHLTLKALPSHIRGQVGLLYLLARLADTIADSKDGDVKGLLEALDLYNERAQGRSSVLPDLTELSALQDNPAEARLLENVEKVIAALGSFSAPDQQRIRQCLDIIVSGQSLDLERFGFSDEGTITPLAHAQELDDYTYKVAGSVGEFWTHLSLDHCFEADEALTTRLFETGVRFGKALQLINILRDIPEDLRLGRCYLPSPVLAEHGLTPEDLLDPANMERFRPLFDLHIDQAAAHLDAAVDYIGLLPHRQYRLRGASMLPVLIGQRTLALLRTGNVLDAEHRIKVLRPEIKRLTRQVLFALPLKGRSRRLLQAMRSS